MPPTIRPGTPLERKRGEFWREVCTCGWIGRQWSSHLAMVRRGGPPLGTPVGEWYRETVAPHRRERYGWYADEQATTRPVRS